MVSRELLQLAPKWREAAGLDLDQQLAPDEVDDETVDELLDAVAGAAVPALELSMQRTLVERSNRGGGCTGAVGEGLVSLPRSGARRSSARCGRSWLKWRM